MKTNPRIADFNVLRIFFGRICNPAFGVAALVLLSSQPTRAGSATWKTSPGSGDWNFAANWGPTTIPNGPADVARFAFSNTTFLSLSAAVEVNEIRFAGGASSYNIALSTASPMTVSGVGVINNSGIAQSFVVGGSAMNFTNNAFVGPLVAFVITGGNPAGVVSFTGTSNACKAPFLIFSQYLNYPADRRSSFGGKTIFSGTSTAGNSAILNYGSLFAGNAPGVTVFSENSNAGHASLNNQGGAQNGSFGGETDFVDSASAANAGLAGFGGVSIGAGGGSFRFFDDSTGGAAGVYLSGNASLDISPHNPPGIEIGSLNNPIEAGPVFLGSNKLTIGSEDQGGFFDGSIQDGGLAGGAGGSVEKIGLGTAVLKGSSLYTGGTTVSAGTLVVGNKAGSGTGDGPVEVLAGTLAGDGIIQGPVTVGSGSGPGAFLAPADGIVEQTTLTIQSLLTLEGDATYDCIVEISRDRPRADQVIANGVSINNGALFSLQTAGQGMLSVGTILTLISNTAATPIAGTFANLPDGSTVVFGSNSYLVSYEGGDGNDLTLTVVP